MYICTCAQWCFEVNANMLMFSRYNAYRVYHLRMFCAVKSDSRSLVWTKTTTLERSKSQSGHKQTLVRLWWERDPTLIQAN